MNKNQINIIDIGAGVGDTLYLINSISLGITTKILCIDGDMEFFKLLNENTKNFKNVICANLLLTNEDDKYENNLVRIHGGTSSSQGENKIIGISLDTLLEKQNIFNKEIHLIKIDVDGFDGKVLSGAKIILSKDKPNIIFEYHPILIRMTNNDFYLPFEILKCAGYTKFIWFDKYGNFSHYGYNEEAIDDIIKLCLSGEHESDWHYDIIALPEKSNIDVIELTSMNFAKKIKKY